MAEFLARRWIGEAALWRLARRFDARSTPRSFCIASAVALPLMLPALQNGQANARTWAWRSALAAASLVERRWSFAARVPRGRHQHQTAGHCSGRGWRSSFTRNSGGGCWPPWPPSF